jgi:catechol 2,3-dioxygenase-like lactoylglutathione lyase family enzyme
MIKRIKLASVFVTDADRAYDFYVRRLGFEPAPLSPGAALGGITRIVFSTDEIQSAYQELFARGVSFSEKPARQIWGAVEAHFADPDGNIFLLVEGDD